MLHYVRYSWQDIHRLGGGWRESYTDWLAWFWTTVCSAEHSRELYLQQVQPTIPYYVRRVLLMPYQLNSYQLHIALFSLVTKWVVQFKSYKIYFKTSL